MCQITDTHTKLFDLYIVKKKKNKQTNKKHKCVSKTKEKFDFELHIVTCLSDGTSFLCTL